MNRKVYMDYLNFFIVILGVFVPLYIERECESLHGIVRIISEYEKNSFNATRHLANDIYVAYMRNDQNVGLLVRTIMSCMAVCHYGYVASYMSVVTVVMYILGYDDVNFL